MVDDYVDTICLHFMIKDEFKDTMFNDFKSGVVNSVHKKWKCRKLKNPKTKRKIYLKGNNSLFFYYKGYDIFYKKTIHLLEDMAITVL